MNSESPAELKILKSKIESLSTENERLKEKLFELDKKMRQYALVFDYSPEAIVFLDIKGNLVKMNSRVTEWLQYEPEELLGKNFLTLPFLTIRSKAAALKNFTERIKGRKVEGYSLEFVTSSGEVKIGWVTGQLIKDNQGKITGGLIMVRDITSQVKYEEELKESRETFKTLTDTTESAIFIVSGTKFRYINKSGERMLGYSLDELKDKNFWDIIHPEERLLVKERGMARQRKEDINSNYEFRVFTKSGEVKWLHYSGGYLEYEGRPSILGNAFDVTNRKMAEEALRQNFARFQAIFNSSAFGIALVDLKGNILDINDSLCGMFGYSGAELKSKNFTKLSHPDDAYIDADVYNKLLKGEVNYYQREKRYSKKDGTIIWTNITVSLIRDKDGSPEYAVGMIEDITEKKQIEQILAREQFLFKTLMKHIPDSIYFKDEKSRFIAVNDATAKKMGLNSSEQLIGKTDFDFFTNDHAEQAYRDEQEMINRNKSIIGVEEKETWPDGTVTWASSTKIPLKDESGNTIGTFGISRDITGKKEIEQKLKEYTEELKQLNASKDRFFSILAHDLRSPFTALLGYSEFIFNDYNLLTRDEVIEFAKNINMVARNVYGLLENLLDWSRIQTGRIQYSPEYFNFNSLAANVINLFNETAKNKKINLVLECDHSVDIYGDENMIHTVIRNLVSNAIKFTKPQGNITIKCNEVENSNVLVSVIDNGVGISPEDVEKLFDLSVIHTTTGTSKETGTGLGLILCKELIEKNKGRIWVESTLGKGSVFNIVLPSTEKN